MKSYFVFFMIVSTYLSALPSFIQGDASLVFASGSLEIHTQGKTIIEWDHFDINLSESVSFIQSDPKSVVLNCVKDASTSQILGKLQANCPIYFINPKGVFIGSSANIEAEGYLFSTGDFSSEIFESEGEPRFETLGEGEIVHLGIIHAKNGEITLAARNCRVDGALIAEGGRIEIESHSAQLTSGALLDVSANEKPGTIEIRESTESLRVDSGAKLRASALLYGDGGSITLAPEKELFFYGMAEASGGLDGGDGGRIHLSSKGPIFQLERDHPIVDARAFQGKAGRVIFDPKFVQISSDGMDSATGNTFDSDSTGTAVISGSTLEMALNVANVTIQANTDILFQDTVAATTAGNGLTLQAGRSILFQGQLSLNGADFNATINDSGAILADRDAGLALFAASNSAALLTQGGNIAIDVGTFGGSQEGEVFFSLATFDAGGGNIELTGFARQDGSDYVYGISLLDSSFLQTSGMGAISLTGYGGNGTMANAGIFLGIATQIQTESGLISLIGNGGGNGTGNGNIGIYSAGTIESQGAITLNGSGGSGVHANMGICLSGGQITTTDGTISLSGTGSGTGAVNFGIRLESNAQCIASGSGTISLSGTSGSGKNNNHGVILANGLIQANSGAISIAGSGQGSQNYNYGIRIETGGQCLSTGGAPITLEGENLSGVNGNNGISLSTPGIAISSSYGNIEVLGTSNGSGSLNQGIRIESGQIVSTGTGGSAAEIHLIGVGGAGTDYCNGVAVLGENSEVTSIDGNIIVEGTASASGSGNQPILVSPSTQVNTTGSGMITYIEH